MSRQINLGERELTEDEVRYLNDRGWGDRVALNDQLLAERGDEDEDDVVDLDRLRVDELRELAREHEVEIPDGAKKADIVRLLLDSQERAG